MKKLVFATQVFTLIAMFPVIVILEMNHTKAGESESNSTSGFKQQTEINSISLPEQKNYTMEKKMFSGTPKIFFSVKTF